MSSFAERRCVHCRTRYSYQASGHGCQEAHNDGRYCPNCKQVVLDALKAVPALFERAEVPTDEVTLAELLQWEKEREARAKAEGRFCARRVRAPLFDMTGSGRVNYTGYVGGRGDRQGRLYAFSYWAIKGGEPINVEIVLVIERNLETGEELPWQDLR